MTNPSETKKQRDRFLAFAFASADLFLEISMESRITYALGASKSLTGFEDEDILGKKMLEQIGRASCRERVCSVV